MKIMMVSCSALPFHNSGVAHVVHNLAKELTRKGDEVYVFTLCEDPLKKEKSIHTVTYEGYEVRAITLHGTRDHYFGHFTTRGYYNPDIEEPLAAYINEIKPDIIHFHSLQGIGANAITKAKTMGYPTVLTMHDWWWICPNFFMVDCHYQPCEQYKVDQAKCSQCLDKVHSLPGASKTLKDFNAEEFLKRRMEYLVHILDTEVDGILVVSKFLEGYMKENLAIATPITINFNGIEETKSKYQPSKVKDKIVFGFLGGKHLIKGYDMLMDVFEHKVEGNWELRIYGVPEVGGNAAKKVIAYLRTRGIKGLYHKLKAIGKSGKTSHPNIHYYGTFSEQEKDRVYHEIDVLLSLSAMRESSSLVVREALIRGIPVIARPSGGPQEVVVHGKNGLILTEETKESLEKAIHEIGQQRKLDEMKDWLRENPYTYCYKEQVEAIEIIYKTATKDNF